MIAPPLVPAMKSGLMPASSRACRTPICAMHLAAPPERAYAMVFLDGVGIRIFSGPEYPAYNISAKIKKPARKDRLFQ